MSQYHSILKSPYNTKEPTRMLILIFIRFYLRYCQQHAHHIILWQSTLSVHLSHNMVLATMSSLPTANKAPGSLPVAPPTTNDTNNSSTISSTQYVSPQCVTNNQKQRRQAETYRLAKKPKVANVYGTGPPRTSTNAVTPVSVLRTATSPTREDTPTSTAGTKTLRFEDEEKVVEQVQHTVADGYYPKPGTYEADLVNDIITAHKHKHHEYLVWDPRGWEEGLFENNPMPDTFCPDCKCPEDKCHVKIFGKYCELKVVNALYNSTDDRLTMADIEQLFIDKYNIALEIKITEETGQLDVKLNGYKLPQCIREQCLHRSLDYAKWYMYHRQMHKAIVVGRGKPQHGHNKLFEHDL
jgi:hypothetical protein